MFIGVFLKKQIVNLVFFLENHVFSEGFSRISTFKKAKMKFS